jgi:hypothetical protein
MVDTQLTSFDDTPIQDRHGDSHTRDCYLPVHPAYHPDTNVVLTLKGGKPLRKLSYINIRDVHELPFSILSLYWGDDDLRLDRRSYKATLTAIWRHTLAKESHRKLVCHGFKPPSVRVYQSAGGRSLVQSHVPASHQIAQPLRLTMNQATYGTTPSGSTVMANSRLQPEAIYITRSEARLGRQSKAYSQLLPISEDSVARLRIPRSSPRYSQDGTWSWWRYIMSLRQPGIWALKLICIVLWLSIFIYIISLILHLLYLGICAITAGWDWLVNIVTTIVETISRWLDSIRHVLDA